MAQEKKEANQVKIAFADDHTAVRKGIVAFLAAMENIKVIIQAENGKELIEKIDAGSIKPDIIIMDIHMPEMTGFEAVPLIRVKWPDMKILVLSTYTEDMYIVRMIRLGVNGFLPKTCDPEEIETALLAIHQHGFYDSNLFREKTFLASQSNKYKLPNLTAKELAFIKLCCSELTYNDISQQMHTTRKSVEGYRDIIFRKLNLGSRVSLVLFAIRTGIVTIDSSPIQ